MITERRRGAYGRDVWWSGHSRSWTDSADGKFRSAVISYLFSYFFLPPSFSFYIHTSSSSSTLVLVPPTYINIYKIGCRLICALVAPRLSLFLLVPPPQASTSEPFRNRRLQCCTSHHCMSLITQRCTGPKSWSWRGLFLSWYAPLLFFCEQQGRNMKEEDFLLFGWMSCQLPVGWLHVAPYCCCIFTVIGSPLFFFFFFGTGGVIHRFFPDDWIPRACGLQLIKEDDEDPAVGGHITLPNMSQFWLLLYSIGQQQVEELSSFFRRIGIISGWRYLMMEGMCIASIKDNNEPSHPSSMLSGASLKSWVTGGAHNRMLHTTTPPLHSMAWKKDVKPSMAMHPKTFNTLNSTLWCVYRVSFCLHIILTAPSLLRNNSFNSAQCRTCLRQTRDIDPTSKRWRSWTLEYRNTRFVL